MRYRGDPVRIGQGAALVVGDRHELKLRPALIGLRQVFEIQPPMQSGNDLVHVLFKHREMQHIDMKMQHVELLSAAFDFIEHGEMRGEIRFERCRIEADRLIAHGDQLSSGACVCCGKQGHFMAEVDQGIGEMCDDPLGPAI